MSRIKADILTEICPYNRMRTPGNLSGRIKEMEKENVWRDWGMILDM